MPDMIRVTCVNCGGPSELPAFLAGKGTYCEHCNAYISVPSPGKIQQGEDEGEGEGEADAAANGAQRTDFESLKADDVGWRERMSSGDEPEQTARSGATWTVATSDDRGTPNAAVGYLVIVLGSGLFAVLSYYGLIPGNDQAHEKSLPATAQAYLERFQGVSEDLAETNDLFPFSPGEQFSRSQIETYIAVRKEIISHLGKASDALKIARAKRVHYERSKSRTEPDNSDIERDASRSERIAVERLEDLLSAKAQALKRQKMSDNEHRWVGRRVFAALYKGEQKGDAGCTGAMQALASTTLKVDPVLRKKREGNLEELRQKLSSASESVNQEEIDLVKESLGDITRPNETLHQEAHMMGLFSY